MTRLRLVRGESGAGATTARPRVSLRLLMAMSGRCTCDDCVASYLAGHRDAGLIGDRHPPRLRSVR